MVIKTYQKGEMEILSIPPQEAVTVSRDKSSTIKTWNDIHQNLTHNLTQGSRRRVGCGGTVIDCCSVFLTLWGSVEKDGNALVDGDFVCLNCMKGLQEK